MGRFLDETRPLVLRLQEGAAFASRAAFVCLEMAQHLSHEAAEWRALARAWQARERADLSRIEEVEREAAERDARWDPPTPVGATP